MKYKTCVHCGLECNHGLEMWNDKAFCCSGCLSVYQLLNENKLSSYYKIEEKPGINVESPKAKNHFAFLDQEEIADKIFSFREKNMCSVKFHIPSIHCSSCIWLLENLRVLNNAIIKSHVNFTKKEVEISFDKDKISLRQLAELLSSIHYIPEINLDSLEKKEPKKDNLSLLYKIGISGFCFANIMLLSLPEYLPGKDFLEREFKDFFGMMNFMIALPVFFYCSQDFFLSAIKSLKHKIINIDLPISLGIVSLFTQSTYSIFFTSQPGYMDSLCGLVFFLLIGRWYQNRTYQALSFERDYKSYFPIAVNKLVNGQEVNIPIDKIKIGDILLIRNNELIPVDAILKSDNANIDYSFVTGEAQPIEKQLSEKVFAGGKQIGTAIEIIVEKQVEQSRLTQLWNEYDNKDKSQLDTISNITSKYFTITILLIAFGASMFWFFIDTQKAIYAFTSVLIVACPCALALSSPFTLGNSMSMMGRYKFYLKSASVIERLNSITSIVFDKTGTLTYVDSVNINYTGKNLSIENKEALKSLTKNSSHIFSKSIHTLFNKNESFAISHYKEITGKGITATIKGKKYKLGSEKFISNTSTKASNSEVHLSVDDIEIGVFSIQNKYRTGLKPLINNLGKKYKLHVLSGDNDSERENISKIFPERSILNFGKTPEEKLKYVEDLQNKGESVLMIGDGLNDAGALKASDVGISIAENIHNFSPACDAILNSKEFINLQKFLNIAKNSITIVKISYAISIAYNIIGISFAVQGILSPIIAAVLMPISSVSVVAFTKIATNYIVKKEIKDKIKPNLVAQLN